MLQNSPFYVNFFFLDQPPPSSRLKFQKYSKTIWQRNIQTPIFFLVFFSVFNTQMLSSVVWCSTYWWSLMYTSAMHFWYCIHLLNTPLYSNVFIPLFQFVSSTFYYYFFVDIEWERSLVATVEEFVMQSDHSASVRVCLHLCVCVCVCV